MNDVGHSLGLGEAAHLWRMCNQGPQDKPHTHSRESLCQDSMLTSALAERPCQFSNKLGLFNIYLCPDRPLLGVYSHKLFYSSFKTLTLSNIPPMSWPNELFAVATETNLAPLRLSLVARCPYLVSVCKIQDKRQDILPHQALICISIAVQLFSY